MLNILIISQLIGLTVGHSDPQDIPPQFDVLNHVPGEPLSPSDFQNAQSITSVTSHHDNDPIELAGLYEGDIILPYGFENRSMDEKNAILDKNERWPGGVIPYVIDAMFNPWERSVIAKAFLEYKMKTCITFIPKTMERDYIYIVRGSGCSSHVGRMGGSQRVTLGNGCVFTGIAIHELLHAVGFWHEQSRWDRNDYVTILKNNISPGMEYNFQRYSWKYIQSLGVPYDTGSIMHYGRYAFSRDRKSPTILPKSPNDKMGQRIELSNNDIEKINKLYECNKEEITTIIPETTPDSNSTSEETIEPITQPCADSHDYCPKWAKNGECKRNAPWMVLNCKKSCNTCNEPCQDSNKYCYTWAQRGECTKNANYMKLYCQKSCHICTDENDNCKDDDKYCEKWSEMGECEKNPKWMLKHCKRSCKVCKNIGESGSESIPEKVGKTDRFIYYRYL